MFNQDLMYYVLIGILLLCGYFYLYQFVAKRTANKNSLPVIAIVLLVIYLFISVSLLLVINRMGSAEFMLLALLVLIACVGVASGVYSLFRNRNSINKTVMALFLLYLFAMGYITIFSRSERRSTEILLTFDSIQEAMRTHSTEPLQHSLMNIVMFIPLGLLFSGIRPGYTDRWRLIIPLGLIFTTIIETTQLLLRLGQCDVEDLVTNTLGACIGLLLYKLYRRFQHE